MDRRGMNKAKSGKRPAVILAGLLIVLAALCVRFVMPAPSKASGSVSARGKADTTSRTTSQAPAQPAAKLVVNWERQLKRDPFVSALVFPPPTRPVPPEPVVEDEAALRATRTEALIKEVRANIKLNGTFLGAQPQAIINGKPCGVGDSIQGFVVRRIGARDVIIEKDGIQLLLAAE